MNTAQNPVSGSWMLLTNPTFQAVLGVLILLAVCWLALCVMARLRDSNNQGLPLDELVRKNFEEMRSGGDISDAEFRNITTLLEEMPRRPSLLTPSTANDSIVSDSNISDSNVNDERQKSK